MPNDISTKHYFEGDLTIFDFGQLMDSCECFEDNELFSLAEPTLCTEHPNFEARYVELEKHLVEKFGFTDAFIPYCIVESDIEHFFIPVGEETPDNSDYDNIMIFM